MEKTPLLTFAFSWLGEKNAFQAGDVAIVKVRPLTDSGGDAKLFLGRHSVRFELSVNGERGNGSCISGISSSFNADYSDWNITFVPILAGQFSLLIAENHYGVSDLSLHFDVIPDLKTIREATFVGERIRMWTGSLTLRVQCENQTLLGSPLSFNVKPDVHRYHQKILQVNEALLFELNMNLIYDRMIMKDHYGNLVSDFYDFDARVIQKETNLSVPIADLLFQEMVQGIQLLSFTVSEPGDFMLIVFDAKKNESISNSPYEYAVFVGYCDGLNSVANGSGLASSDAGQISYFSVYLEDTYHNPAPVEPDRVHVKIMRRDGAFSIRADVTPMGISYGIIFRTGRRPSPGHINVARSPGGIVPAMLVKPKDDHSPEIISINFWDQENSLQFFHKNSETTSALIRFMSFVTSGMFL
ncbi:Protein GAMETE EXPRESSED 2 [Acorus calamus]|uniref:Protein GAMETE EXPRESSED 2 n=1 Tax=Acorus calamus TaxID=4465 RepID=A0AAV9ET76_ACOCL|nr:Protein GAMETE EXPRESSED 2 [Acorus calamus]